MQMILFYDLMPWSKVTSIGPSTQIILVYDELKGPQKLPGKKINLYSKKVTEGTKVASVSKGWKG